MRSVARSFLLAFMGTGVFFSFLMMIVIPIQAALARISDNISKLSVVVNPGIFLRSIGVPMAIAVFLILFSIAMYKQHHIEKQPVRT